ncbi:hypothetical protein MTO96_028740 [Rhipicephalus appendiculatus]
MSYISKQADVVKRLQSDEILSAKEECGGNTKAAMSPQEQTVTEVSEYHDDNVKKTQHKHIQSGKCEYDGEDDEATNRWRIQGDKFMLRTELLRGRETPEAEEDKHETSIMEYEDGGIEKNQPANDEDRGIEGGADEEWSIACGASAALSHTLHI